MVRAVAFPFLLLAGCSGPSETPIEDVAGDAAYDTLADSGIESRFQTLEEQLSDQADRINDLQFELATAKATAEDAEARVSSLEARLY